MERLKWDRLRRAVETALDADATSRDSIVAGVCGDDSELLTEARSLLAHAGNTAVPAEPPLGNAGERVLLESAAMAEVGRRLGPYRLVAVLATGSTGTVFRALRDDASFDREVAIKVLRDAADPEALARFSRELHALARAEHPGICRLLDAGIAPDVPPRSYIVMELVRGVPIDEHVRRPGVSLESRLRLLIEVCEAVAHAHALGIVHRDLKPANILVDGAGAPKIIDFGVARLLGEPRGATWRTETGRVIGTLAYMSPEQIAGDPDRIDHRTDVYGLGVVLWEVLAGRPAFDIHGRPFIQAARVVEREDPDRLGSLDRSFRGDLETIVTTALQKDPARRYQSARALADDLARFLRAEPIAARRPTLAYRAATFARRNRTLVAATSAVIAALTLSTIVATAGLIHARQEARRATAATEFLGELLAAADPLATAAAPGSDGVQTVDLLDAGVLRLDAGALKDPITEATVRHRIGAAYAGLGLPHAAVTQLRAALDTRRSNRGRDHAETIETETSLASALVVLSRFDEARPLLAHALACAERHADPADDLLFDARLASVSCELFGGDAEAARATADRLLASERATGASPQRIALAQAAAVITGIPFVTLDESEHAGREALAALKDSGGDRHLVGGLCASTMGMVAEFRGDLESAEHRYRDAWDCVRGLLGPEDGRAAAFLSGLGQLQCRREHYTEAEASLRPAVAALLRAYGPADLRTWGARESLAAALEGQGRIDEAIAECQAQLAGATPAVSHANRESAAARLACLLHIRGDSVEAEAIARRSLESCRAVPEFMPTVLAAEALATILRDTGRAAEAADLLAPIVAYWQEEQFEDPSVRPRLRASYGLCLAAAGHHADAERELTESIAALNAMLGPGNHMSRIAQAALTHLRATPPEGHP